MNEKLYWADYCAGNLEVFDPATGGRKVLIHTGGFFNLDGPKDIVLDPSTR